jgi:MFS family permease
LSVFTAASGSGFAAGMILGGVITATLGWRWVFDINVPIGIIVSLLSIKYISTSTTGLADSQKNKHLDILGAVSITAGLMLLVYSLSSAQNIGIGSVETLELLLLSAVVLSAFLLIEYRSKAPLMPLGFLKRSSIFGANAIGLLQFAAFVGMVFILSNYLQQVRGYSALSTGVVFLPSGIVAVIVSGFLSARLVNHFGVKPIIIYGMALQTMAYLLLSQVSITESYFGLLVPMLLIGAGVGLGITAVNIAALSGTRKGEEGLASGLINTSRQIGGPIGLAILLTVANFGISAPTSRLAVHSATLTMVPDFSYAFLAAALLTLIGIVFAVSLRQERHRPASAVLGAAQAVHQS